MQDNNYISPGPRTDSNPTGQPSPLTNTAANPASKSKKPIIIIGAIVAFVAIVTAVIIGVMLINANQKKDNPTPQPEEEHFIYEGKRLFEMDVSENELIGIPEAFVVRSWDEMNYYLSNNEKLATEIADRSEEFDFTAHSYAIVRISDGCQVNVAGVGITEINGDHAKALIEINTHCGLCAPSFYFYIVPFDNNSVTDIEAETRILSTEECDPEVVYKPVIYLYPTKITEVSVKLGAPEKLLVSYPTYTTGWRVKAQPDGSLTDLNTSRGLYSLYYEADYEHHTIRDEGFIVKGSDTTVFLEEKLTKLGLNDREAEEFIIYWLPKLQNNAYNYIYFALTAETAENMPLEVSPAPDTVIRFTMEYYPLQSPLQIKEQKLPETPKRTGFTLVEWGGSLLHPNYN